MSKVRLLVHQVQIRLCTFFMKLAENYPDKNDLRMKEIFTSPIYESCTEEKKLDMRISSAQIFYDYEKSDADSWLMKYFMPRVSAEELSDSTLLDLGCFTGGRLVYWVERYSLRHGYGLDISEIYARAGQDFSRLRGLDNVFFNAGCGETLPYRDNKFDFIVSTDVMEHVSDVSRVLSECYRVLKPGGKLLVVFPQYLQPFESHLISVTKTPALQWFFNAKILTEAYVKIIKSRKDSEWYLPNPYPLRSWEKLPTLNGTSHEKFMSLVHDLEWSMIDERISPLFGDGRKSKGIVFRLLQILCLPLANIPYVGELFLGRVNVILTK